MHRDTSLHFFSPFAKGSGKRPFTLLAPTDTAWNETFGGCLKACPRAAAVWHVCGARAMAAAGMAGGRRPYILWSCLLLGSCVPTASLCKQCLHCPPAAPPALLPAACPSASPLPCTLAAWPEQRPLCSRHPTPCPCPPALRVPNIAGTASEDERGALRQGLAALLLYHQILTAGYSAQQLAERYDAPTALGPSIGKEMKVDVSGIDILGISLHGLPWLLCAALPALGPSIGRTGHESAVSAAWVARLLLCLTLQWGWLHLGAVAFVSRACKQRLPPHGRRPDGCPLCHPFGRFNAL